VSNVFSPSTDDYPSQRAPRGSWSRTRIARWFFLLGVSTSLFAAGIALGLMRLLGRGSGEPFHIPAAFIASTLLLAAGSAVLSGALRAVRRERLARFRRRMAQAVAVGGLFMGIQTYALWTILPVDRSADSASLGVAPFAIMLAVVHGLHFLVATLFASYVAVQARAGRYDHEYHWGVRVCTGFWHALGVAWLAILAVYSIVAW
jgi:cytochrome c oxidase subunit 3